MQCNFGLKSEPEIWQWRGNNHHRYLLGEHQVCTTNIPRVIALNNKKDMMYWVKPLDLGASICI